MSQIFNPQQKILCHLDKVESYFNNKNPDPITIEIDPSNSCNHSCSFCISGHLHLQKYKGTEFFNRTILEKECFEKLIKELVTTNIQAINWTGGGEPKNNSNIEMGMFTNGSMLKKFDLFETFSKSLSWIRISIDAGEEKTYNDLRKTNNSNNFKVVIENIKKLIETKKKIKSKIVIGVGFVVTKDN